MKLKFFLLGFVIQLTTFNSYSQFVRKDYIVKPSFDTLYGKIETQSDIDFRASVLFYDNEGKTTNLSPDEILAFYIEDDNRLFESKRISINGNDPSPVFLRCLIKGTVSLYLLREKEEMNNRYFYQKGEYMEELTNTKVQKTINGKLYNTYNFEYVLTLKNELLKFCNEMLAEVDKLEFKEKELAYFFEKVNKCIPEENQSKLYLVKKKVLLRTGLNANFGNDKDWPAKGLSYGIGIYQEYKMPEISQKFFLSYGLDIEYGISDKDESEIREKYYKISVPLLFNFEISRQNIQPYILVGINYVSYLTAKSSNVTGGSEFPITLGGGVKTKRLNFIITSNIADTRLKFVFFLK